MRNGTPGLNVGRMLVPSVSHRMTINEGISLMKKFLFATVLAAAAVPAFAANVAGSVGINVPGLYGRIDIGNEPPPQVVYRQPVVIQRGPDYVQQPIYLHVPPGHAKNWRRHCAEYNACGQPVYFVQEQWYRSQYVPRHRDDRGDRRDYGRGDNNDHRGNDRRNHERRDNDRGRGPGNDRGDDRGR